MLSPEEKLERANAASRKWKLANPEKVNAARKARYARDPEKARASTEYNREYMREWRKRNKERDKTNDLSWKQANKVKVRGYHLKAKFGLTHDDYNNMLESQGFVCAVCLEPSDKTYHVDHDHTSGKVRGLLCNPCNRGLGYFKDSKTVIASAYKYLDFHKELTQ